MSESNPIRIYVIHRFAEDGDYLRIFEYLESRPNFFYRNCSNPAAKRAGRDMEAAKQEIRTQMQPAEIVILPVTVFGADPVLVTYQMDLARTQNKPILAVKSFGDTMIIKKNMLERVAEIVDWNDRAIVDAVKRLARQDATSSWEVVDFKLD